MHVLAAQQFSPAEMGEIFESAEAFRPIFTNPDYRREVYASHLGEQVCSIFYEASTRTKGSFELAAMKLGMGVFETENAGQFSSISKGESIEDTTRVLASYGPAAIIMRTKEEGVARRAAAVSPVPIINGGDGKGEHPTQSLLDAYTINREKGQLSDLKIVMGGDLARGRTVRSLAQILNKFRGNHITFVSTPDLGIGDDIKAALEDGGTSFSETSDMHEPLHDADVVYWTRLQRERAGEGETDELVDPRFVIDAVALEAMAKGAMIMHPLPRVGEIVPDQVDHDPRAFFNQQAQNGIFVRMALLDRAVGEAYTYPNFIK